jgi:hypothetical protein
MAEEEELITAEQVNTVLQFSNALNGYLRTGAWSPFSQNQNLLNLTNAPVEATYEKLIDALSKSLNNAEDIQGYSEFMNVFDTIYAKTLRYYKNMLSFDLSWYCINANDEDYKSKEYKEDYKRMQKFLMNFDYKREFPNKVIPQLLTSGVFYTWFRDSYGTIDDTEEELEYNVKRQHRYSLQVMPQGRCTITGYSDSGFLYDLDMSYYIDPSVDVLLYDPSIKKKLDGLTNKGNTKYLPHARFSKRNGKYGLWEQTDPNDGAWVFKFDEDTARIIPPFASLMKPAINNTAIHKLQMDKDIASAWAILYGNIGLLDKEKSGQKPNQTAFSPEVMGQFMNLVQSSLKSIMKTVALPLENTKFGQFSDSNVNMENNALSTSAGQGAFGSSLIYDGSSSKNQSLVLNSIIADYNIMKQLYPQFARMLEFYCNKKTRKYKWRFEFNGSNYPFEREYRRTAINELAEKGLTLPAQYWASAYGYDPVGFVKAMNEAHYGDFQDNITLLMNASQTSGEALMESERGRPQKSETQQSDETATSHNYE